MPSTLINETFSQHAFIRHAFFTREVGDCGWPHGAGGESASVARNRAKAALTLGVPPERLLLCRQVHSAMVVTLEPQGFPNNTVPEADAMATNHPRLALGILTADCAPVLLADPVARVIGAAHAGWRGAIGGILENTLAAMERLGAKSKRILAAIGPCIGPNSYEVSSGFLAPFLAEDPENEKFFSPLEHGFLQAWPSLPAIADEKSGTHYLFSLPGYIQSKLQKFGLHAVAPSPADTYADPERFFSYRRACQSGNSVTGRLISAIVLGE